MARNERTVAWRSFRYTDEGGRVRTASRGDLIALSSEEEAEAERIGAIQAGAGKPEGEPELDMDAATVEELEEWLTDERPTVAEVLSRAGSDPDLAQRLLDAEDAATGGDPRRGVEAGLLKVIEAE